MNGQTTKLNGRDFEKIVKERLDAESDAGRIQAGRYGVQTAVVGSNSDGSPRLVAIKSLPDFEGCWPPIGQQFITDAKVVSGASFSLGEYRFLDDTKGRKARQLKHMYERSRVGVVCFFTIHFNARELKKKSEEAATFVFPVHHDVAFWESFLRGEVKSITREDCALIGNEVQWNTRGRELKARPDVIGAAERLRNRYWAWSPQDFAGATA